MHNRQRNLLKKFISEVRDELLKREKPEFSDRIRFAFRDQPVKDEDQFIKILDDKEDDLGPVPPTAEKPKYILDPYVKFW